MSETDTCNASVGPISAGLGRVKDWHDPYNYHCEHNMVPAIDCSCKRHVTRKPYRIVKVDDPEAMRAHRIISEIHPNGLLVLREKGRRKRVSITLGVLFERLVLNEALKAVRERKAARKARRSK